MARKRNKKKLTQKQINEQWEQLQRVASDSAKRAREKLQNEQEKINRKKSK